MAELFRGHVIKLSSVRTRHGLYCSVQLSQIRPIEIQLKDIFDRFTHITANHTDRTIQGARGLVKHARQTCAQSSYCSHLSIIADRRH